MAINDYIKPEQQQLVSSTVVSSAAPTAMDDHRVVATVRAVEELVNGSALATDHWAITKIQRKPDHIFVTVQCYFRFPVTIP